VGFPETTFEACGTVPRNTRQPCGQCGQNQRTEAENSAATASIAGENGRFEAQKTHILLAFSRWHGVC